MRFTNTYDRLSASRLMATGRHDLHAKICYKKIQRVVKARSPHLSPSHPIIFGHRKVFAIRDKQ